MIFDAHTHFFGRTFLDGLAMQLNIRENGAQEVARRLGWDLPGEDPADVARRWVAEMDRHGVDRMLSIHTLPGDVNEVARGIAGSGGRLIGYVMVNPLAEGALETVKRAVTQHGFRGVAVFPAMFRFAMTAESVYEILSFANENALNVFVHCGVLKVCFRTKLGLPCAFDASFSNPLHLQRPAAEFAKVKFIIPHLGSGLFRELLMLADQAPNVYADTSGVGGWAKYLDGAPSPAQVLRQAVDVMGASRLLFGSDSTFFPRGWRRDIYEQQMGIFREAKIAEDDVRLILGENLRALSS